MATTALPLPKAISAGNAYRYRYIIAVTVALASMLELVDISIVNVAIPHMMGNLGATLDEIAWVSTGYIVANVIVLPITGWLSSLFGRRRYFAGSIALFTVASFFAGHAHSLEALVVWRIIQGLGGGALISTSQAILFEIFPREEQGMAQAIFGVSVMVGPTLGPTLGGYLTDALSWPWIFFINLPFGILALILTLTFVPDSEHSEKIGRIDWQGLLLLALGIGTLQTMLERGERLDWFASNEIILYAVVSVTSLVLFIWHELRTDSPVVDLRILKIRQFSMGVIFGGLMGVALFGSIFALPIYLQALQGFSAEQTGFVILPGALASAAVMAMMGRVAGKIDLRPVVLVGVVLFVASMWQHAHFTTASGKADYFWPLILRGAGLGMIFVPLVTLTMSDLPLSRMAQGTGLFNLLRQLGGSVGIALAATLLSRFEAAHRAQLTEHITLYSDPVRERLGALTSRLIAAGTPQPLAESKALHILSLQIDRQVMMLSFEQLFLLFGASLAVALPLLLFMKRPRGTQKIDVH